MSNFKGLLRSDPIVGRAPAQAMGAHFQRGGDWPQEVAVLELDATEAALVIEVESILYGAAYLRLDNDSTAERMLALSVENQDPAVAWRLTTPAGEIVMGSVAVPPASSFVIVAVVVPVEEQSAQTLDFDTRNIVLHLTEL